MNQWTLDPPTPINTSSPRGAIGYVQVLVINGSPVFPPTPPIAVDRPRLVSPDMSIGSLSSTSSPSSDLDQYARHWETLFTLSRPGAPLPNLTFGRMTPQLPGQDLNSEQSPSSEILQRIGNESELLHKKEWSTPTRFLQMSSSDHTTPCVRLQKISPNHNSEEISPFSCFGDNQELGSPIEHFKSAARRSTSNLRLPNGGMATEEKKTSSSMNSEEWWTYPTF